MLSNLKTEIKASLHLHSIHESQNFAHSCYRYFFSREKNFLDNSFSTNVHNYILQNIQFNLLKNILN